LAETGTVLSELMVWVARRLRPLRLGRKLISSVKSRASLDLTHVLHKEVAHKARVFSVAIQDSNWHLGGESAIELCTACRRIMGNLLELPEHEIHCCLKGFLSGEAEKGGYKVATVARSEPYDMRVPTPEQYDAHPVTKNSVWSAFLGENDGKFSWGGIRCFHCGDLYEQKDKFQCTRKDWEDYYRSTLVFPIFYMDDSKTRHRVISGFLAFDSKNKGAFRNLPDIFEWRDKELNKYRTLLEGKAQFHLGASLADMFGIFLEPLRKV